MKYNIGEKIEVFSIDELPKVPDYLKYFICIGGGKNYECFLETKKLSRADFMKKYRNKIDSCHIPIYEDDDLIIRQDAQIPIPGFYIVATKSSYKKISDMDFTLYQKCLYYAFLIKKELLNNFFINRVFIYYDEHYQKPSSTHFWIMPIYDSVLKEYNLNPTILNYDIWEYQDLFEFQSTKNDIYRINNIMKKKLNERGKII